jgi:hypothetical protein
VALHRRGTLKEVQPEEDWIGQKRIKEALGTYPERTVTSIPQKVFDALASNEEAALQILAEIDRGTLGVEGLWRHSVEVYAPAGYFAVRLQSPVGASTPKNRVLRLIPRNRNQILVAIHERLRGTKPRKKTSFPPISEELRQILDKTLVPDRFYDWFRKGIFKIGGGLTTDSHSIVAYSEIKERIDEEQLREALEQGHYGWLEFFTDL